MPSMSIETIIALVTLLTTCLPLGLLLWRVIKQKRRNAQLVQDLEVGYTPRPERRTLVRIDSIVQTQATFQILRYFDDNGFPEVL